MDLTKIFKSNRELINAFSTEQECIEFLEHFRWNGVPVSPYDANSKVYKCKGNRYKCKNTGRDFNVKTGTLFENSKIGLPRWFEAIRYITSFKKGISSCQLAKEINVTQKTAWFMFHRIRKCFCIETEQLGYENPVEMDETYIGGKHKNRHKNPQEKGFQGRSTKHKTPVWGAVERKGKVIARVVPNTQKYTLMPHIEENIKEDCYVMTDEWGAYKWLYQNYIHYVIKHKEKQWVDGKVHTNTIEGFWSFMKRGLLGTYHLTIKKKHLQKYVDEFVFRYNTRKQKEHDRFILFFANMQNRLRYKELIA